MVNNGFERDVGLTRLQLLNRVARIRRLLLEHLLRAQSEQSFADNVVKPVHFFWLRIVRVLQFDFVADFVLEKDSIRFGVHDDHSLAKVIQEELVTSLLLFKLSQLVFDAPEMQNDLVEEDVQGYEGDEKNAQVQDQVQKGIALVLVEHTSGDDDEDLTDCDD